MPKLKPKERQTKDVLHLRGIDPNVKRLFHAACVKRKRTMTEVYESLMRVFIKRPSVINGWTREEVEALGDVS